MSTRETIIEQSTRLFAEKGYNGVSVRTIARATGITEGSIYNHFSSKMAILDEILDRHEAQLKRQMPTGQQLIDAYDKEGWKPAWVHRIKVLESNPGEVDLNIVRILTGEQYKNGKASNIVVTYYIDEPVKITRELFEFLEARGEKLPGKPGELAMSYQYPLFGLTQEYAVYMSMGMDMTPVIEKMKQHVSFFWKNIIGKDFDFS